jgi:hypothetical protein
MNTEIWTSRECATYRRCSLRTLDRERERGDGCPYIRVGERIFYRRGDVERFIEEHVCGDRAAEPLSASSEPPHRRRCRVPLEREAKHAAP